MARPALIRAVTNAIRGACDRYIGSRTRSGAIEIEWGGDLESLGFRGTDWDGSAFEARVKARCARCWGGLVARYDDRHQITGIKHP